jgi:hypothetical protein
MLKAWTVLTLHTGFVGIDLCCGPKLKERGLGILVLKFGEIEKIHLTLTYPSGQIDRVEIVRL